MVKTLTIISLSVILKLFISPVLAVEPTPAPLQPTVYPIKIYMAQQVDPRFATPDNIVNIINQRLSRDGINKQVQGTTIITYDQTVPTSCIASSNPLIYLPPEHCSYRFDGNILLSVVHAQAIGAGGGEASAIVSDEYYYLGDPNSDPYTVLMHELGHVLGFERHYDDNWTANVKNQSANYKSPYFNDIMGMGTSHFLEHSREIINRRNYLYGFGPSLINTNLPDAINLKDPNNQPFKGTVTVYPAISGNEHTARAVDTAVYFDPIIVNGILDYKSLHKPLLAMIIATNQYGTATTWLDSAVIQMQFYRGEPPTININLNSDSTVVPPIPTPPPPPSPRGIIAYKGYVRQNADIFSIYPDGSNQRDFDFRPESNESKASFSINGKYMAYLSYQTPNTIIILNNRITGDTTEVPILIPNYFPSRIDMVLVGPDDTHLFLTMHTNSGWRIYRMGFYGADPQLLMETNTLDDHILATSISSDGQKIAVLKSTSATSDIYIYNSDGSNGQLLSNDHNIIKYDPIISPLNDKIVYFTSANSQIDLYAINLDTKQVSQLTSTPDIVETTAAFSPDGNFLVAMATTRTNPYYSDLYLYRKDGSLIRQLTNTPLSDEEIGPAAWGKDLSASGVSYDLNLDGMIDIFDYRQFINEFSSISAPSDFNSSGKADIFDFNLFLKNLIVF